MKKTIFTLALGLVIPFVLFPACGQSVDWLQAARGAQHLSIPRYAGPTRTLYAVVRVDKVSTEYEKHGLFHIGALPVVVLEGFTYEIKDPVPAATNLAQLRSWLGGEQNLRVEARGVKFVASPDHRLEGAGLRFIDKDHCQLVGGVRLISGTNEMLAETATLKTTGPEAGEVVLQTTPPTTNAFFLGPIAHDSAAVTVNTPSK